AVYARTVGFGYVMHDDDKMILENPLVKEGINPGLAFTTDAWFMDARIELYRPWQSITYMTDYAIGKDSATVYHVHNLIIFLLGAFLLFYFLQYYFKPLVAWAGTILYSVNLLTPHVVGWIAARGDLYLMVFGLLFLILIQRHLKKGTSNYLWLSVPVFFMALISKESAVVLLPVGVVMFLAERKKLTTTTWTWIGINALVFIIYYVMRGKAIADAGNMSVMAFFQNLRSFAEETFKMIIPAGFSVMPGYSWIWTLAGTLMLGVIGYGLWKYTPDRKILFTGATLWLALLLPSLSYQPSFAGVAYDYLDHRTWLPYAGLWLLILGILEKIKFPSHKMAPVVFGGILMVWAATNVWRSGVYQDWEHYYANAIKTNPGSGLANLNYGSLLRDGGNWETALPYIEKGVSLSPEYTDAKVRLAEAYFNLKRYPEAIAVATDALAKEPKNISALQFRGSSYGASGNTQAAAGDFKVILESDPENPHGLFNLGVAYKEANLMNEAIETFSRLLHLNPDFPNAYYERGFCYGKMGLFPQARADMEQSIKKQPEHGPSYFFRGRTSEALGDIEGACADWLKAKELGTPEAEAFIQAKCQSAGQ
ncbi:MAG: tetratricopeptide repeat protein, partial [Bacteroidota bacterium]|nr:tetratricopeptide repeat protein [Bacteroidota bacterium]